MMDFENARANMVYSQLRTTDVTSHSVLSAFLNVPREMFVPASIRHIAYADEDLQIFPAKDGHPARYVMKTSPLAKLLQLAAITKGDVVLEIGGATGYVAAILSHLAGSVVSLECDKTLAAIATETLAVLGYDNVVVVTGDLKKGYASVGPYDLILVNGSVEEVPSALTAQLRDGGQLVVVVGYGNAARATVYRRDGTGTSAVMFFNVSIKPLPGFAKSKEFVF